MFLTVKDRPHSKENVVGNIVIQLLVLQIFHNQCSMWQLLDFKQKS